MSSLSTYESSHLLLSRSMFDAKESVEVGLHSTSSLVLASVVLKELALPNAENSNMLRRL